MADTPRITEIRAIPVFEPREKGADTSTNEYTVVVVETDAGVRGYGSAYTSADLVRAALGRLEPLYAGEIATEPLRVAEKLDQQTYWWGRGGTLTHAASGIDIALWDIFGRVTGQPVSRLLGGRYRDRVKPYASLSLGDSDPGRLRAMLEEQMARGFRAFKLGWGRFGRTDNSADDELIVRTARETIGDGELMIDPGASEQFWQHGLTWAVRTARMLETYEVTWFEEALRPDALEDFVRLRERSGVMISGGEVLTRRQSFAPFLDAGAWDIVQPDCTKAGGISAAFHVGWLAERHNVRLVPHGWNTAIGLAADVQLVAALPNAKWVEYHQPSAVIDELPRTPFKLDEDGMLAVPDGPGLGVDLDESALARLSRGV